MNTYHRKQAALAERRRLATEAAAKIRAERAAGQTPMLPAIDPGVASGVIDSETLAITPAEGLAMEAESTTASLPYGSEVVEEEILTFDEAEESGEELPISEDSQVDDAPEPADTIATDAVKPTTPKRTRKRKKKS